MLKLKNSASSSYKPGFYFLITHSYFPRGINKEILKLLSYKKKDNKFISNFRLHAYNVWKRMKFPKWSNLELNLVNFKKIKYYSVPKKNRFLKTLNPDIFSIFKKLGINFSEKNNTIGKDLIYNSISVKIIFKQKLNKQGIIFNSISEGIKKFPSLIEKFLSKCIPVSDNFFAALNSVIFSDGSFCYVPQNTICSYEISSYFRIDNNTNSQFERTLIVAEKNSFIKYFETCTATINNNINQLHNAIVELIAFDNSKIFYSTNQNWYKGNNVGLGGIYNFVTKRGLCIGKKSYISWSQAELGSSITWKYPSCILIGNNSKGEFYSLTLTNKYQQVDTGSKMIHIGKNTISKIISKSVISHFSNNIYRGLVKIGANAFFSKNYSQCDAYIIGNKGNSITLPYINIYNSTSIIEHEAKVTDIENEKLFYIMQRGFNLEESLDILINGYFNDILKKFSTEFSFEIKEILLQQFRNII